MNNNELPEHRYCADSGSTNGFAVWWSMATDFWSYKELFWGLGSRDIKVSYRQSILGYVWAVILPLATVALFTYLSSSRVLPIGDTDMPYPAYAIWGVVFWQLFAGILVASTSSLTQAGSLVTKISFPKEIVVFSSVFRPLLEFFVKLVLVAAVLWVYDVHVAVSVLWLVPLIAITVIMAVGFGLVFSLANLVIRDIANVVALFVTFGLFAAPILYPPPTNEPFSYLVIANPFAPLLLASHDILTTGVVRYPLLLLYSVSMAVVLFLFGWRIFRIVLPRVVERA